MNNNFVINQKIISVERAAAELRRGRFIVIIDDDTALLVASAELIIDQKLSQFKELAKNAPLVGLTYNRANILKISPRSGDVALVKIKEYMSSAVINSMADPANDLINIMQGPFVVADIKARPAHDGGIKLCKIAKLLPAAIFSHNLNFKIDIKKWCQDHNILWLKADDVLEHTQNDATALNIITSAKIPLQAAENATMVAFRPNDGGTEHFAILIGDPPRDQAILTRIHSECFTGDLLGSLKCDCGDQLRGAIKFMDKQGGGVLLYLAQEGRGIGLINKLRAYHLQDQGFDTIDANERLGFLADERIFEPAAKMLELMGYGQVKLLTNNPEKVKGLENCGIIIQERIAHHFPSNGHNEFYLKTKKKRSGHLL